MEQIIPAEETGILQNDIDTQPPDKNFKPKGAIAFFILLILLALIIWYGIYFLMLSRT